MNVLYIQDWEISSATSNIMGTILLESKIRVPVQQLRTVPRPRLESTLQEQVTQHKLTTVLAPAGYGKTTLVAEWARKTSLPVAWVSVAREENDLEQFMRYLVAAWEKRQPELIDLPVGILTGSQMPDIDSILHTFVNAADQILDQTVFILDDYHTIHEKAIHEAVTFLLDHLPSMYHFIIISRSDPPLPLARYRARRQLFEIRAGDLSFTNQETAEFFHRLNFRLLPPDELKALHMQTEGWVAGLQLASVAIEHRQHRDESVLLVSGRQRFIADYLREDVMDYLPAGTQEFLLKTSLLDRLCGPLCDAVTGQEDGQMMLDNLERENLFTTPLDDERLWFRYHPLFSDFLRSEIEKRDPQLVNKVHQRAADWYFSEDMPDQAFDHAVAGGNAEQGVKIIDKYFNEKVSGGEIKVIEHWIESLPASWVDTYPVLDLIRVGLLVYTGAFEACVRLVDDIENRLSAQNSKEVSWQLGRVQVVRCFIACSQNDLAKAETYADLALRELSTTDIGFLPGVYGALGDTYRRNARWDEAKDCYYRALEFVHSPTIRIQSAHVFGALADLELRQGHLKDAAGYWSKALSSIRKRENWGRIPLPVIGWVYIRMGEVLYEWNRLAEAWDHVSRGLERAELGGDTRALIAGGLIAARLKLTEGEFESAEAYLERTYNLLEPVQLPEWTSQYERLQLELWLAQDKLRTAVNWSDRMIGSTSFEGRPESVVTQLAIARVLIVKGDEQSLVQSRALLDRLLRIAEEQGQTRVTIEALTLLSLTDWMQGESARAMTSLDQALRLAEPEGYIRLFADLGLPVARLMQEAVSREAMPGYAVSLLEVFAADLPINDSTRVVLTEPLTHREQEVLKLIAAGLTNREIADALVISPETVKKHTGNIYGKLQVSNRTEAAASARELDLLS